LLDGESLTRLSQGAMHKVGGVSVSIFGDKSATAK
jgi:hypothetical protein